METKTNSKYWEKITAYFSNELNTEELNSIETWAEGYDEKELLMEMNKKMKQVEKARHMYIEQTDMAWDKLHSRIKQEEKPKMSFFSMHRNFIGIAASIVVMLSVGFGIFKLMQNDLQMNSLQTAFNQSQIELSDGTIVYLNGILLNLRVKPVQLNWLEKHILMLNTMNSILLLSKLIMQEFKFWELHLMFVPLIRKAM